MKFTSSPPFVSRRRCRSPSPSRALTTVVTVEEGACGYDDDDDEQQWPNEAEMVAEVRQRVSNMAGVTNEEVRIVASSYRICPLGAHIGQQEILKSKFGAGSSVIMKSCCFLLSTAIIAPKLIRATPDLVTELEDLSQPWTRSLN
ncbi:Galacturonokinase [Arachis hypogaea]|nr:Galacturonokinase [Arachis hypogaea]